MIDQQEFATQNQNQHKHQVFSIKRQKCFDSKNASISFVNLNLFQIKQNSRHTKISSSKRCFRSSSKRCFRLLTPGFESAVQMVWLQTWWQRQNNVHITKSWKSNIFRKKTKSIVINKQHFSHFELLQYWKQVSA